MHQTSGLDLSAAEFRATRAPWGNRAMEAKTRRPSCSKWNAKPTCAGAHSWIRAPAIETRQVRIEGTWAVRMGRIGLSGMDEHWVERECIRPRAALGGGPPRSAPGFPGAHLFKPDYVPAVAAGRTVPCGVEISVARGRLAPPHGSHRPPGGRERGV